MAEIILTFAQLKKKVFDKFNFVCYANTKEIWMNVNGLWINTDKISTNNVNNELAVNSYISKFLGLDNLTEKGKPIVTFRNIKGEIINERTKREIFRGIAFKNCYINESGVHETRNIPFTTTQINRFLPKEKLENKRMDETLAKLLKKISGGDSKWLAKLLMLLSTCLDNKNWSVFAILIGSTSIGKSLLLGMMSEYIGLENFDTIDGKQLLGGESGRFALKGIRDVIMIHSDELPQKFEEYAINKIKQVANPGMMAYERKGGNDTKVENLATWIGTMNEEPSFYNSLADDAIKARFVIFKFKNVNSDLTSEEWAYLGNNKIRVIETLIPFLIEKWLQLQKNGWNRASKFMTKETSEFWGNVRDEDQLLDWIENNKSIIIKSKSIEIVGRYKDDTGNDIKKGVMIQKLKQYGYIYKGVFKDGKTIKCWTIDELKLKHNHDEIINKNFDKEKGLEIPADIEYETPISNYGAVDLKELDKAPEPIELSDEEIERMVG